MPIVRLRDGIVGHGQKLPVVMTIAGSDSSGGAGIEADLKTFTAHKVYGATCITALTAQNTTGVKSIHPIPKETVNEVLKAVFEDFLYEYSDPPLKVVKTGMLTQDAVEVLSDYVNDLIDKEVKLVLDPVMISTSGSQLFDEKGMRLCIENIISKAYIITPNFPEALVLLKLVDDNESFTGVDDVKSLEDLKNLARTLQTKLQCENILVKGGHIPWNKTTEKPFQTHDKPEDKVVLDVLYESLKDRFTIFLANAIDSEDSHGTGCTLASSIAANIAKSKTLVEAIGISIDYIHEGMVNMTHKLGRGNGPINHLIEPALDFHKVLEKDVQQFLDLLRTDVLHYFKEHPEIKANWETYTNHRFVKLLAENKLPFHQFLYFLKQDYYYLINYAQIHALAASVAPNYSQTHSESLIILEIVNEIEKHKQKLADNYDIVYERDIDLDIELSPGPACSNYCNFLLEKGKSEDYLGIKVALAPCLFGYYEAGIQGVEIRKTHDGSMNVLTSTTHSDTYDSWLGDYVSDWYSTAYKNGQEALQELFTKPIAQARLDQLVQYFNEVTKLEIAFWDEVLEV